MKKETIIKNNILIAKFMGAFEDDFDELGVGWHFPKKESYMPRQAPDAEELAYHRSWEWLIPVVEKIALLKNGNSIRIVYNTGCTDSFSAMTIRKWDDAKKQYSYTLTPYGKEEDGSEGFLYNVYKTVVRYIETNKNEKRDET